MRVDLNAENFTLKLSLKREEALERQLLVKSTAKEVLGKSGVHGLESVTGDRVIAMPHSNTAL